jgi:hypothetical protein
MQVGHKWCSILNKDNLKHKLYMAYNLGEEVPLPYPIIYFVSLHGVTSKWHFFLGFSSGSPKIGTFVVLKF